MSLGTPEGIRILQTKLYEKAKKEPGYRFYSLYDKVHRRDILEHAYGRVRRNRGARGVDGITFEDIEQGGLESWIQGLEKELREKLYRPEAVKRVWIPKPDGSKRPLGIPTIRDRVAQMAAMIVLGPIFEADFSEEMYGYRENRSALGAVREVHETLKQGYTDVVDADLTQYFDTIPHAELMRSLAKRISDGEILALIKKWLKVPIEEEDEQGRKRRTGGKKRSRGTPQGGVLSPLLANIYMNRFLKAWRGWKMEEKLRAKVIIYADDFVILCKGTANEAMAVSKGIMERIGLKLNEQKTRLVEAKKESFGFLGYSFGPMVHRPTGRKYLGVSPSDKSQKRYRERIRKILRRGSTAPWEEIAKQANRVTEGWARYFCYGTVSRAYWKMDAYLLERARNFLRKRHRIPGRGTRQLPAEKVFGPLGLRSFQSLKGVVTSYALS